MIITVTHFSKAFSALMAQFGHANSPASASLKASKESLTAYRMGAPGPPPFGLLPAPVFLAHLLGHMYQAPVIPGAGKRAFSQEEGQRHVRDVSKGGKQS